MPSESVKVIVRVRPMNGRERDKQCTNIVTCDVPNLQITLANPLETETSKVFSYDSVFPMDSQQQTVYEQGAFALVESVIEGYNGTIFAYGQTGCGKTHTMMGVPNDENLKGVIPRAFDHIFGRIKGTGAGSQKTYLIQCSYIEIYNEEIRDLIGEDTKAKLDLKENPDRTVFIKGLSKHVVTSVKEIDRLMTLGSKNRSVGETAMNKDSSRSHSIFTIYVENQEIDAATGDARIALGKLNLVDLAGSERQSKTGATGDRLKEANKINLSLSALGNVISALVDGKSQHIPYRDSKLTRLLQDSLGGNTKTVMIANCSPASDNYDETLGTLRYASRAKNIKNQPKVNEDPKDALLREYADEINRLKEQLKNGGEGLRSSNQGTPTNKPKREASNSHLDEQLKQKENLINDERKKREELETKLKAMQEQMVKGGAQTNNKNDKEQSEKYNAMAQKLKDQNDKHEQLLLEKQQKEEEVLMAEKKYANLQEEVEEQRKLIKKLRKKCKDAVAEVKDLEREHELNKEDLLDTIRLLEKDVKINNAIMSYMVSPEELEKIRAKARWKDDRNEFVVPPFIIRAKKVKFPKLAGNQALALVQEEWNERELEFQDNKYNRASDDDDDYAEDRDWETASTGNESKFDNSPPKGKYGSGNYSSGNKHAKSESLNRNDYSNNNNMFYDNKGGSNLLKNAGKGGFDMQALRETFRGGMQVQPLQSQSQPKKNSTAAVRLDPIGSSQLSTVNSRSDFTTPEKGLKAPGLNQPGGSASGVKGKPQLQPINHAAVGGNKGTMKLSFKATVLINNDGSNAELQNMSSHIKGY